MVEASKLSKVKGKVKRKIGQGRFSDFHSFAILLFCSDIIHFPKEFNFCSYFCCFPFEVFGKNYFITYVI
jgi:hypothetical protein